MATAIKVRASNPGYPGRWRAGRFFQNGQQYDMVVVPDPSPEELKAEEKKPTVDRKRKADYPLTASGEPDMTRISESGRAELEGDSHMSVLGSDDTEVKELAGELGGLKTENARLQAILDEAEEEFHGLRKANGELIEANTDLIKANEGFKARISELEAELAKKPKAVAEEKPAKADETKVAASGEKAEAKAEKNPKADSKASK